jgi:hypothetical protein
MLPTATVLVNPISPPISSTNRRAIDSARPVPPKRRVVDPSACVNGVNKRSSATGSMPMPVSCTVQRRRKRSDARSRAGRCCHHQPVTRFSSNSFLEAAGCSNSADGSHPSLMQSSAGLPVVQDLVRISEQKGFCVIRTGSCGALFKLVHVSASLGSPR